MHRRERRDLSEGLKLLGGALQMGDPDRASLAQPPRRMPSARRARRPVVLGGTVAGVLAGAVACAFWFSTLGDPSPTPGPGSTVGSQTTAEWAACARLVAIGTITDTRTVGGRTRIALSVEESLKPREPAKTTTLTFEDRQNIGLDPLRTGVRYLLVVPQNDALPVDAFEGQAMRSNAKVVRTALAEAAANEITCPGYWRTTAPD